MNYEQEIAAKQRAMMNVGISGGLGQAQLGNALAPPPPTPLVQQQMRLLSEEIDRMLDKLRVLQARLEPTVLSQVPTPVCPTKDSPTAYPVGLAESIAMQTRGVIAAHSVVCDILERLEV